MEIIDNFLELDDFKHLQKTVLGMDFPWKYATSIIGPTDSSGNKVDYHDYDFQFVHLFYSGNLWHSDEYEILGPVLNKLNPIALVRIKANMGVRTHERISHGFHVDIGCMKEDVITGVYYINSNDGKTIFESGEEVDSVANRMVLFRGDKVHTGTTCTNRKVRCVINFNFIPAKYDENSEPYEYDDILSRLNTSPRKRM